MRGERDLDIPLRGRADLADLRAFRHGHRRPGDDRAQWEVRGQPSWRLFTACRLRSALLGSGRSSLALLRNRGEGAYQDEFSDEFQVRRVSEPVPGLAFALVADAELFRLESVVRWLEVEEERLRRAGADGWPDAPPAPVAPVSMAVLQRRRRMAAKR